jgi:hypothetical protein
MTAVVAVAHDVGGAWRMGGIEKRERIPWDDARIKAIAAAAMILLGGRAKKEHRIQQGDVTSQHEGQRRRSRPAVQCEVSDKMRLPAMHFDFDFSWIQTLCSSHGIYPPHVSRCVV